MKKSIAFFFMLFVTSYCFNQTENSSKQVKIEATPAHLKKASTTSNGIVSYQAAGVEGFKKEELPLINTPRELSSFSPEELELALNQLDAKILTLENEPENSPKKLQYLSTREKIIEQINNNKPKN